MSRAFPRVDGELRAGRHRISELATEFGTPLYVYDADVMESRYRRLERAFDGVDLLLAYSVKANSNFELLRRLLSLGAGVDIVSLGELHRCLQVGFPGDRIVFAGVGKTRAEMTAALDAGILAFNVESEEELHVLSRIARESGRRAPIALRVNPDIVADTPHEYTRTGQGTSKFGIPVDRILDLYGGRRSGPSWRYAESTSISGHRSWTRSRIEGRSVRY